MAGSIKKAALFTGLTFFFSYLMVFLYLALGGRWAAPGSLVLSVAYMFVPMTGALVVQRLIYREPLREPFGLSFKLNRWFLVAWLLPPLIAFATLGVSLLFPGIEFSPEMAGMFERFKSSLTPEQLQEMRNQAAALPVHPIWLALLQGLIAGVTVNAVAAFGEELGWRGLLQRELGCIGFWKSSAIIGIIWGLWHAPLILQGHNYPQHPLAGVLMMTIFTLLLSPVFGYIRLKAKSVIAAAIMHGTLNGTYGLAIMVIKGGNDLTVGVTGLAGFVVLVCVNLGLVVYDRIFAKEPITGSF
ncbi:MAG: CPBP family intramembrane metalloprotease [Firmicutes bacterium]|nr:CPBP family intramembrane metalloprotease [Bacillota bacterium]